MEFHIFFRLAEGLVRVYTVDRNKNGFYIITIQPGTLESHQTYHTDGNSFLHVKGKIIAKARAAPLAELRGIYTVASMQFTIGAPVTRLKTQARKDDIVIDRPNPAGVDLFLSDSRQDFPPAPDRINPEVHVREWPKWGGPIMLIEVYGLPGTPFAMTSPRSRHPSPFAWNWDLGKLG